MTRVFFVRQGAFSQEYSVYSKEKQRSMAEKGLSVGRFVIFQTSPSINQMYFPLLKKLIIENYSFFENVFDGESFELVKHHLEAINKGRACADHGYTEDSENWSWTHFESFRASMTWLEKVLISYD